MRWWGVHSCHITFIIVSVAWSSLLTTPPPNTQTRRLIFLTCSFALSCFFADLSGTEGFLYKHSTSINVFVIKHRPGHVISQTSWDGAGGMDVAWQAAGLPPSPSRRVKPSRSRASPHAESDLHGSSCFPRGSFSLVVGLKYSLICIEFLFMIL